MNNLESLPFIYPELILAGFALILLIAGVFGLCRKTLGLWALMGVVVSALFLSASPQTGSGLFFNMLAQGPMSIFFQQIILIATSVIIIFSLRYASYDQNDQGEYYFFILIATLSMMFAVAANNLLMIYIALEAVSVIGYILAGYLKKDMYCSEAGLKYFLFGAVSTGIMLYGISLVYGLFGSFDVASISHVIRAGAVVGPAAIVAFVLVLVGLGFKCSLVPFHMWTPDVYQGAPTPVAAFLSVGPKVMGFAILLRMFLPDAQAIMPGWTLLAGAIAILSMTIGNITALKQSEIKRLLAYSTIAQAGFIFLGLAVATPAGVKASLFYIFIYAIMNLGAFGAVIAAFHLIGSDKTEDYAGLYQKDPLIAVVLAVSLLSLAGIPPLAGFFAKFFVLAAAVKVNYILLAVLAVVNSVIALYYYLKVIKFMFLDPPKHTAVASSAGSSSLRFVLILTMLANFVIGIWPQPILIWITRLLP